MYVLPFQTTPEEYSIFVLLDDEGIERIKAYDPAQVDVAKTLAGMPVRPGQRLMHIIIGYANQEDMKHVLELFQQGLRAEALKFLSRGFEFRPDLGDHDGPYVTLLRKPS